MGETTVLADDTGYVADQTKTKTRVLSIEDAVGIAGTEAVGEGEVNADLRSRINLNF